MRFILIRASAGAALEATARWGARLLLAGERLRWTELTHDACFVIPLLDAPEPASARPVPPQDEAVEIAHE